MKLKVKLDNSCHVEDIERNDAPDWIESYQKDNQNKNPILPDIFYPLVNNYTKGQRISQSISVIPVSGQQWQLMTSGEKAQLLELVEWLGQTAEDYCREFQSHFPRDPKRRKN